TARGTLIEDGANFTVSGGGTAIAPVLSGLQLNILSGGVVSNATIFEFETVLSGGTDVSAHISGGLGVQSVNSGGTASGARVISQGEQLVRAGGLALGAVVSVNAVQVVFGIASGTTIASGGSSFVDSGSTASSTVLLSGGTELV